MSFRGPQGWPKRYGVPGRVRSNAYKYAQEACIEARQYDVAIVELKFAEERSKTAAAISGH
ncbi:MAG TPA: hypothetical protein DCZ10_07695 [Pelotomaculum sp.]|nr:hypothetical protein [Pelotomaculum sp.]